MNFSFFAVLNAINDDSPTVPGLLTDYILKGLYLLPLLKIVNEPNKQC